MHAREGCKRPPEYRPTLPRYPEKQGRFLNSVKSCAVAGPWLEVIMMSHVAKEKAKLVNRLKRLRGQIDAIERAIEADDECAEVLQQATACRGALDGFIAELIEDHIREHMVDPRATNNDPRSVAAEELIDIIHSYLKK
jgi:FrmR/RcnR family transcriptional regulator, repressor of frmRAB operon